MLTLGRTAQMGRNALRAQRFVQPVLLRLFFCGSLCRGTTYLSIFFLRDGLVAVHDLRGQPWSFHYGHLCQGWYDLLRMFLDKGLGAGGALARGPCAAASPI